MTTIEPPRGVYSTASDNRSRTTMPATGSGSVRTLALGVAHLKLDLTVIGHYQCAEGASLPEHRTAVLTLEAVVHHRLQDEPAGEQHHQYAAHKQRQQP